MHEKPPVLYVEDDPEIAEMTSEVLSEVYEVDLATDGIAARDLALNRRYEVMVVDRRLPGIDGVQLVEAIRTAHIATPILMLTAAGSTSERVSGLDAGANDYLVKPFEFEELLARLRALRRAFTVSGRRRDLGEWSFAPGSRALYSPTGLRIPLTETENALLDVLSESPDHVFSRAEILEAVFSVDDTPGSVDTYVSYLRRKSTPGIVETVRGVGYRVGTP